MSRIHIRFIKEIESDCCATYRVESSDFNDNHINESIARITINRDLENKEEGFCDPKGGEDWARNPNGSGSGWRDANGDVWIPSGPRPGAAHGGPLIGMYKRQAVVI